MRLFIKVITAFYGGLEIQVYGEEDNPCEVSIRKIK